MLFHRVVFAAIPSIIALLGQNPVTATDDGTYQPLPRDASSKDGAVIPAGVKFRPNVPFQGGDSQSSLHLDLAFPIAGKGPFPAVLCLHGGAWTTGSRKTISVIFELARRGYVAASADYRLAPAHPFPAAIHDSKAALRWLRANAKELRIDPERIAIVGYSSGGYLGLMVGCTDGNPFMEGPCEGLGATVCVAGVLGMPGAASTLVPNGKYSSRVQAVVSHYGVSDLEELYRSNVTNGNALAAVGTRVALTAFLGGTPDKLRTRYREASPVWKIHAETPPILLTHGTADWMSPAAQSRTFAERLRKAGGQVEEVILEGAEHGYGSGVGGQFGCRADDEMFVFLARRLKP